MKKKRILSNDPRNVRQRDYRARNKAKTYATQRRYVKRNEEAVRAYHADYYERHRSEIMARVSAYQKANPDKASTHTARQRRATPRWANRFFIDEIYALARQRTRLRTGNHRWVVDHRIPLRGETVSGLHVHTNLRVIPALDNARKRNRLASQPVITW
jgi:hypothetical protein